PPPEQGQPARGKRQGATPGTGQACGPLNMPEQNRGKAPEIQRGRTTPPAGPSAAERRGGAERGLPGYGQPGAPPTGAAPGEPRGGKERGQPGLNRPPTTPPAGAGPGEARGARERGQGAYGQPSRQPRVAAPAPAELGPAQERGKKKGEGT